MPDGFELGDFLPYRLAVFSERVSRRLSVDYGRTHGLNIAEWRVLVHLQRIGPVSVRDIQRFVNLGKPRISRAVGRLEKRGLVTKAPGKQDGRLVEISLSQTGQAALADILPAASAFAGALEQAVPPDELATFYRVIDRLHDALDADPNADPRT